MLSEGVRLMAVGMTTVFAFLALLVLVMYASARFFATYGDRFADDPMPSPRGSLEDAETPEIAAVLAIAEAWRRQHDEEV